MREDVAIIEMRDWKVSLCFAWSERRNVSECAVVRRVDSKALLLCFVLSERICERRLILLLGSKIGGLCR